MRIALSKNAPIRQEIAESTASVAVCARRYGVSEPTIRQWRRSECHDRSYTPHRLQTTLNAIQEAIVVAIQPDQTVKSARIPYALYAACPIKIVRILTDRLFASRICEPSGNHEFDRLCQALGIEHRLT